MTVFSRRILPLAAVIATTAMLSAWVTAGAAQQQPKSASIAVIHFEASPTSHHVITNGATQKRPAGAEVMEAVKLTTGGKLIGRAFLTSTQINGTRSLTTISAVFFGKGLVELQGEWGNGPNNTSVVTGGTGDFAGVSGEAVGHKHNVVLTYS